MEYIEINLIKESGEIVNLNKLPLVQGKEIDLDEVKSNKISVYLSKLKFDPTLEGYRYCKDCILKVIKDPTKLDSMMNLYEEVAEIYGSKGIRVERNIRNSIELAWSRIDDVDLIKDIFCNMISLSKKKPTNSQFISASAYYLINTSYLL